MRQNYMSCKEKQLFISYRQFQKLFPVCISVIVSRSKADIAKFLLLLMSSRVLTLYFVVDLTCSLSLSLVFFMTGSL